ncbi:diguanylate cyclase domain-containing protein [Agrobacterium leguminum]|uniref:sensor domain-containing diguanylate cyclase n=1 Tax=Agrobacterium leguminum TaxID=2792015 RepID=UPI003CE5AE00
MELLLSPACLFGYMGSVMYLNSAWREYAGFGSVVDGPLVWEQLIHPDDRYAARAHLLSAIVTGGRRDCECRLVDSRGAARWFRLSLQPANEDLTGPRIWMCMGTDIHDLKQREADLEKRASIQTDMLDISVDCIKLIAPDGTLVHMNRAGCQALGVPEGSLFGMPWLPLLPEDVWTIGEQALVSARTGVFARFPGRSVLPGQKPQHWDNMLTPIIGVGGQVTAILCVSREVTAEREALEALRDSQERLAIAVRIGGIGIWDYNIQRDELQCDGTWYRIMGRDQDCPIRSIAEFRPFIHPEDVNQATEVMQTAAELIAANRDYAIVFRIIRPNGDIRWVRSAACLIQDASGNPMRAVGFVSDITDAWRGELALRDANRALEEEKTSLARQSREDPLTGIANRRHLDSELARICVHAGETGQPVCVGMVDVDYFKAYNDRYGHVAGDVVLRRIASALQSVARQSDLVARYGGEEFVFVLTGMTNPAPVLERFATVIAELAIIHEGSPTGYLTISCGCVVFNSSTHLSPILLLEASDKVLYEAKSTGRNRHIIRSITQ